MSKYLGTSNLIGTGFVLKAIGLTLISWMPLRTVESLSERWDAAEARKLMMRAPILQMQGEEEARLQRYVIVQLH